MTGQHEELSALDCSPFLHVVLVYEITLVSQGFRGAFGPEGTPRDTKDRPGVEGWGPVAKTNYLITYLHVAHAAKL